MPMRNDRVMRANVSVAVADANDYSRGTGTAGIVAYSCLNTVSIRDQRMTWSDAIGQRIEGQQLFFKARNLHSVQ